MKIKTGSMSAKSPTYLALALLAGMGMAAMLQCQPAFAQTSSETVNPLEDFQNQDTSSDPFSNRGSSNNAVFDWIHRAMMGGSQSSEDFAADQQENLDDAAAQFRKQQQELLRNQQQAQPTQPTAPTSTSGQR